MYGYHLTSLENWEKIQANGGIDPYRAIEHEEKFVEVGFAWPVMGVWIWKSRLDKYSELLSAVWHVQKKKTKQVVVLRIEYCESDKLVAVNNGRKTVGIVHRLSIEDNVSFYENAKATLLTDKVLMYRIKFVKQYDFSEYVRFGWEVPK